MKSHKSTLSLILAGALALCTPALAAPDGPGGPGGGGSTGGSGGGGGAPGGGNDDARNHWAHATDIYPSHPDVQYAECDVHGATMQVGSADVDLDVLYNRAVAQSHAPVSGCDANAINWTSARLVEHWWYEGPNLNGVGRARVDTTFIAFGQRARLGDSSSSTVTHAEMTAHGFIDNINEQIVVNYIGSDAAPLTPFVPTLRNFYIDTQEDDADMVTPNSISDWRWTGTGWQVLDEFTIEIEVVQYALTRSKFGGSSSSLTSQDIFYGASFSIW